MMDLSKKDHSSYPQNKIKNSKHWISVILSGILNLVIFSFNIRIQINCIWIRVHLTFNQLKCNNNNRNWKWMMILVNLVESKLI